MTRSEILKKEILNQYKSVRAFCMETDIPYSTLVTALERGVEGMAYGTVIRICEKLSINPVDFSQIDDHSAVNRKLVEKKVIGSFMRFNKEGRRRVLDMMDDYALIDKYREFPDQQ